MAISQKRPKRKLTSGKYKKLSHKKKRDLGRAPSHVLIKEKVLRKIRVRGGNEKLRLLSEKFVNLYDPQTKKIQKTEIINVLENPANHHFARMGIITKGTVIQTNLGKAKITSRPGQHGIINAVLIK